MFGPSFPERGLAGFSEVSVPRTVTRTCLPVIDSPAFEANSVFLRPVRPGLSRILWSFRKDPHQLPESRRHGGGTDDRTCIEALDLVQHKFSIYDSRIYAESVQAGAKGISRQESASAGRAAVPAILRAATIHSRRSPAFPRTGGFHSASFWHGPTVMYD